MQVGSIYHNKTVRYISVEEDSHYFLTLFLSVVPYRYQIQTKERDLLASLVLVISKVHLPFNTNITQYNSNMSTNRGVDIGAASESFNGWTTTEVRFNRFADLPTARGQFVASPAF